MKVRVLPLLLVIFLSTLVNAQDATSKWLEGSNSILSIYERHADPYFRRFAQNAYPPGTDKKLIDAQYKVYKQKSEMLGDELRSAIKAKKEMFAGEYSRQQLLNVVQFTYRNNFPGLDYTFFQTCNAETAN
ncbi:MAG: hypothetical protein JST14_17900 [Bacteroidetes bacterium]|nr:hypothetical protein [Bacteroidota bacterium]